jgi:hypothetical protein
VLATGGGHSDGYLRFWNNSNGTCQQAIKTDSQVRRNLNIYFSIKSFLFRYPQYYGQLIINKL